MNSNTDVSSVGLYDGLSAHSSSSWSATSLDAYMHEQQQQQSTHVVESQHSAGYHHSHHHQRRCACCFKPLGDYEPFIEYLYKFYHNECFRCHMCLKNFSSSTPSSSQSTGASMSEDAMSIVINKYGQLVCLKDYIENLKCQICLRNFDMNSKIHHLKNPDEPSPSFSTASSNCNQMTHDDLLVHAECVKCDECLAPIDVSCEYTIKKRREATTPTKRLKAGAAVVGQEFILSCRTCAVRKYQPSSAIVAASVLATRPPPAHAEYERNIPAHQKNRKVKKQYKHRLSSRQKEMLINELILNNVDLNRNSSSETDKLVMNLAKEIRCSPKAILDYISKHKLNSNSSSSIINSQQQLFLNKSALQAASQGKTITNMLDQLNKIDRILAPNRCPFDNDNSNDLDDEELSPAVVMAAAGHLQHAGSSVGLVVRS